MYFYLKLYAATIPVFFAIDLLWLGLIARGFYKKNLDHLLSQDVNWPAAILFYFIYIVGIIVFAVRPGLDSNSFLKAAQWGALYGFFTYMTYDLTNLATLKGWPINVVVVDIIWGTILCTSVSISSYYIGQWLQK